MLRDLIVDRGCGVVGLRVLRLLGRVVVFADTVDCLRDARVATAPVRRVTVVVAWWTTPWRGWSGRVGALAGVVSERVRYPRRGRGMVTIDLRLARPTPLGEVLAAAGYAVRPTRPLPASPTGAAPKILLDEGRLNPRGRRPQAYGQQAPRFTLDFTPDGGQLHGSPGNPPPWCWPGPARWRSIRGGDLAWPAVTALRSVGAIECPAVPGLDPVAEAGTLVALAMTGVVLTAGGLNGSVAELLAPELRAILAEPLPAGGLVASLPAKRPTSREDLRPAGLVASLPAKRPTSPEDLRPAGLAQAGAEPVRAGALAWEIRSVRQRRAALRGHSIYFGGGSVPAVSALLATRRAEHLPTILRAIAGQTYPNLEIVLCLHGIELPDDCRALIDHCGRPVEVVPVPADVSFGSALGLATARASGTLVTKFDDDDTYGAEHVWDLVLARQFSGATLVGKGIEFVYLEDADITVRRRSGRPEAAADVVAGGTMLIARGELEELGGWRPVPRSVDLGLLDRVTRAGAMIYRTHPLGYLYHRRAQGHTWQAEDEFFLRTASQKWTGLLREAEFGTD